MSKSAYLTLFFFIFDVHLLMASIESVESAAEVNLKKAIVQLELAKAAADLDVVKASAELELAKVSAQVQLAKALTELELAKASSEVDIVKATSQLELVKVNAQIDEVKAQAQLRLVKAIRELELVKAKAQVELVKATTQLDLAKILAQEEPKVDEQKDAQEESKVDEQEPAQEESKVDEQEPVDEEPKVEEQEDAQEEPKIEEQEDAQEEPKIEEQELIKKETVNGDYHFDAQLVITQSSNPRTIKKVSFIKSLDIQLLPTLSLFVSEHFGESLWADSPYTKVGVYSIADFCRPGLGVVFQDETLIFNTKSVSNSIGIGLRQIDCKKRLFGGYVFYDYLKGDCANLHQFSFTAEFRGRCFDMRCNAFFPIARKSGFGETSFYNEYKGPYCVYITPIEYFFRGVEFSVGKRVALCHNFCFDGFLGGYYLDNPFKCQTVGFQAFGEVSWCSRFFAGFFLTQDNFCGRLIEGYCGITIPFYFRSCCKSNDCIRSSCCLRDAIVRRFSTGVRGCAVDYKKNW